MKLSETQALGTKRCSRFLAHARKATLRLKSLSETLNQIASAVQVEYMAAAENMEAVKNMCGLVALPCEVLVHIFEFVVNGDARLQHSARTTAAVTLSHVCQYFRETALSCPQLWANMTWTGEKAASYLSRSRDVPLDVKLAVMFLFGDDPVELLFEEDLLKALFYSTRWRRLHIGVMSDCKHDFLENSIRIADPDIYSALCKVNAPLLDSLHIESDALASSFHQSCEMFAHWDTPNLRSVTSLNCFPVSLSSLANATTLDISLPLNQLDFTILLEHLSRMHALEDFTLKLDRSSVWYSTHPEILPSEPYVRTKLPSVRRLRIETFFEDNLDPWSSNFWGGEYNSTPSRLKRTLFASLFFPGVVDLRIRLRGEMLKHEPTSYASYVDLAKEMTAIFSDVEQFPRVESFRLEVCGTPFSGHNVNHWIDSPDNYITLDIPLEMLPGTKHFTIHLQSETPVEIHRMWFNEQLSLLPEPALATITIEQPTSTIWSTSIRFYVEEILQKQRERGEWGQFRELVLVAHDDTDGQAETKTVETFVGDAALAWCDSVRHIS